MAKSRQPRAALAIALAGAAGLVAGCSTPAQAPAHRPATRPMASSVMPTDLVRAHERSAGATGLTGRFEFGRLDASLGIRRPAPFTAENDWPQALRPPERPIRFRRWEQR